LVDVRLDNPDGHLHVITAGDKGCPGRMSTTDTARLLGCKVATNAGFFNMQTGDCIGNVVSRSHLVQLSGLRNVNIGLTPAGWLVGYFTKKSVQHIQFKELVSGIIWLVRDGMPFWEESEIIETPDFMEILAPRTILGHDVMGRAVLVVVEGTESVDADGRMASGVTIAELGKLALDLKLHNAINLDGGGSSAFLFNGQMMNRITETCPDDPSSICERLVTTIICIK
jgi:N-acetylglucosamine-1-phosphodiester alpha-N-acetylglucosaminidase